MAPTKVLFVTSAGRSGSTLLGTLLGQIPGVINVGEMRMIWHRSLLENCACGCGRPFDACPLWSAVLDSGFGGVNAYRAQANFAATRAFTRTRYIPRMMFPPTRRRTIARSGRYLVVLRDLYSAVAEETGSSLIADTSKVPAYGRALQSVDGLEVYVLQLVRDSRAVAYSWIRKKVHPDTGQPMGTKGLSAASPVGAGVSWGLSNLAAETILDTKHRYMRLGYEQLIRDPKAAISAIGAFVGEPTISGDRLSLEGDTVELQPTHTVFGNPNRFEVGTVRLRVDDAWRRQLSAPARVGVTAATWPLLYRYRKSL